MKRRTLVFAGLLAAAALSSCSVFPDAGGGAGSRISGKFSASVSFRGKNDSQTGSFLFSEAPDGTLTLDLGHAVTGTLARITVLPGGLSRLQDRNGSVRESSSPEALLLDALGFSVPVTPLYRRLSSAESPDHEAFSLWTADIVKRAENGLPLLVRLSRPETADSPAVRLTAAVTERSTL